MAFLLIGVVGCSTPNGPKGQIINEKHVKNKLAHGIKTTLQGSGIKAQGILKINTAAEVAGRTTRQIFSDIAISGIVQAQGNTMLEFEDKANLLFMKVYQVGQEIAYYKTYFHNPIYQVSPHLIRIINLARFDVEKFRILSSQEDTANDLMVEGELTEVQKVIPERYSGFVGSITVKVRIIFHLDGQTNIINNISIVEIIEARTSFLLWNIKFVMESQADLEVTRVIGELQLEIPQDVKRVISLRSGPR